MLFLARIGRPSINSLAASANASLVAGGGVGGNASSTGGGSGGTTAAGAATGGAAGATTVNVNGAPVNLILIEAPHYLNAKLPGPRKLCRPTWPHFLTNHNSDNCKNTVGDVNDSNNDGSYNALTTILNSKHEVTTATYPVLFGDVSCRLCALLLSYYFSNQRIINRMYVFR